MFEINDDAGFALRRCEQQITIGNDTPFIGDIEWPQDFTSECGTAADLIPEALGELFAFPRFLSGDDECSLLGFDYKDQFFAENPLTGECGVVRRSWTVVDWCNQVNGEFVTFPTDGPYVQTITITNDVAPDILPQEDLVFSSNNIDCESGELAIIREATDDCTPAASIAWSYSVTDINGRAVSVDVEGNTLPGNSPELNATFIAGTYTLAWTACDGCGNCSTSRQHLEVVNTKSPIPICMNGLSVSLDLSLIHI